MKKRVSPGARRAINLIQARSISRLETAFGRCDRCRFGRLKSGRRRLDHITEEYPQAVEAGDAPSRKEMFSQHPELDERLRGL